MRLRRRDVGKTWATMAESDSAAPEKKPKLKKKDFEGELERLQHELVVLQEYIKAKGLKVVV
ncbi:MAG: hypothetical protein QOE31_1990, partial [Solirubrobacteraceae bacterium]|nr:hypothetical protein [Solirubrobacteraceae bacterium]